MMSHVLKINLKSDVGVMLLLAGIAAMCRSPESPGSGKERPHPSEASMSGDGTLGNRLSNEKSPYLLQHARNPVDWYPWGELAFETAKREDKPVFLSIGYATCHWCHVMAHESFEDDEVARLMNEHFICIKVDREERPDVDNIYMTVAQLMTGSGGWPLTVVMTPDKKPFFAATYIPKKARFGRKGMRQLIPEIAEAWKTMRPQINASAKQITRALASVAAGTPGNQPPGERALHLAFNQLALRFDHKNGGFGRDMKFPTPHQLVFLMRYHQRTGNPGALEMVEKTLTAMRFGGIYDHVGYGFHRYATDPEWLVPHFEKMLYDQALLLFAYLEAFQATKNKLFADTAREIAAYVLRDMTAPSGGFYSAEDADSEGVEGKFYVWERSEVAELLDKETASTLVDVFNVTEAGNFSEDGTGETGANILHMTEPLSDVAARLGVLEDTLTEQVEEGLRKLFHARSKRMRPLKDDKVLTDWNGLMLGAFAKAGRVLGDSVYVAAAEKCARFIRLSLRDDTGRLLHRYRDGEAGLPAHLEDYAFVAHGLIELYQTTFNPDYLQEALQVTDQMIRRFKDKDGGAFFLTAEDTETVLVRAKELYDGAIPSGNGVAVSNLVRLAKLTGRTDLEAWADRIAAGYGPSLEQAPSTYTMFLVALDFAIGPSVEVVIAGERGRDDTVALLDAVREVYAPAKVVLLRDEATRESLEALAPFVANQPPVSERATAYVCVDQACSFPTNDADEMRDIINTKLSPPRSIRPVKPQGAVNRPLMRE
jgi:hypothetical protein